MTYRWIGLVSLLSSMMLGSCDDKSSAKTQERTVEKNEQRRAERTTGPIAIQELKVTAS